MNDPVINTNSLTKVFKDFWGRTKVPALKSLDLTVQPGEIFGLLGPNGSGKSTTMKLLLGLLHPTKGSVTILGSSPRRASTRERVGYLPEEAQLYQHLTAAEALHFYGGLFGLSRSTVRERTGQLLDMVGLTHAANRPVGEFSKGMARRIGLAQALINDPDLLILDEPTAGLDPVGCRQIKDLLRALAARGKTVVLSSHLLADVQDVCDRLMLLHNGCSLVSGSMAELLTQPDCTRFTLNSPTQEQTEAIKTAIQDICGAAPTLDSPTMALETFFVKTISEAKASADPVPSGVSQRTTLAPFLKSS
jgi:ABC-2 type transport system ATP-binding protein